MNNVEGIKKI